MRTELLALIRETIVVSEIEIKCTSMCNFDVINRHGNYFSLLVSM